MAASSTIDGVGNERAAWHVMILSSQRVKRKKFYCVRRHQSSGALHGAIGGQAEALPKSSGVAVCPKGKSPGKFACCKTFCTSPLKSKQHHGGTKELKELELSIQKAVSLSFLDSAFYSLYQAGT